MNPSIQLFATDMEIMIQKPILTQMAPIQMKTSSDFEQHMI